MRSQIKCMRLSIAGMILLSLAGLCEERSAAAEPAFYLSCRADNDLFQALTAGGAKCSRHDSPAEAVKAAPAGAGVLILADGYPERPTVVEPAVFDEAARKKLRLFVEYPAALPDMKVGPPKDISRVERAVVVSRFFGDALKPMRVMTVNACRVVPATVAKPHVVMARVAGVDTAEFGLKDTPTTPLLFAHPRGHLLVATSKLSHFVTGRYMPDEAWRTLWQTILARMQNETDTAKIKLSWTPTVRPSYSRDEKLPENIEMQALQRSVGWFFKSRLFRAPTWPKPVLDRSYGAGIVNERPGADCPSGDGSLGVLECFYSTIRLDGSQPMRYAVRNDCTCEAAMLMGLNAAVTKDSKYAQVAENLVDFIVNKSGLPIGAPVNPKLAVYGLVGWDLSDPIGLYGDDNARAMLGMLTISGLQKKTQWNDAIARNMLALLRLTGPNGYRPGYFNKEFNKNDSWEKFGKVNAYTEHTAHSTAWTWACFLWAYEKTHFKPFLERSEAGFKTYMAAYPKWDYTNGSGSLEMARSLLPLAWLVRVKDTPEHRRWLRHVADDLIALQDDCGAIREIIRNGNGAYKNCVAKKNADFGTCETSLVQSDGPSVSDMLYTCNFALIGLHEAAAATGDPFYSKAEEKLAKFLCRIQVRSEKHPELDGAWYRAFNYKNWDYWASNSDGDWGPWCTESGWTQGWIAGTLALRHMNTSLWDIAQQAKISDNFEKIRQEMLP